VKSGAGEMRRLRQWIVADTVWDDVYDGAVVAADGDWRPGPLDLRDQAGEMSLRFVRADIFHARIIVSLVWLVKQWPLTWLSFPRAALGWLAVQACWTRLSLD
jgi:hypothetical protein